MFEFFVIHLINWTQWKKKTTKFNKNDRFENNEYSRLQVIITFNKMCVTVCVLQTNNNNNKNVPHWIEPKLKLTTGSLENSLSKHLLLTNNLSHSCFHTMQSNPIYRHSIINLKQIINFNQIENGKLIDSNMHAQMTSLRAWGAISD